MCVIIIIFFLFSLLWVAFLRNFIKKPLQNEEKLGSVLSALARGSNLSLSIFQRLSPNSLLAKAVGVNQIPLHYFSRSKEFEETWMETIFHLKCYCFCFNDFDSNFRRKIWKIPKNRFYFCRFLDKI